jgi:transcriptional regulator with XRE-family HTH domain
MSCDNPIYPIGRRITYLREQKNISVNKLANAAGISQSYLRDIELENKNPTVEIVALICQALGITLKDFFNDDTTMLLQEDPLLQRIYKLTPKQRDALLVFLNTMDEKNF